MIFRRCSIRTRAGTTSLALALLLTGSPLAIGAQQSDADLAKATQNPLASMISVPVQNNTNFGIGPDSRTQNVMNIQPVYPFALSENWNWVTRTILPIITQPDLSQSTGSSTGFGDLLFTSWFVPAAPGALIWGVGPVISVPLGAEEVTSDRWAFGPSVVGLTMTGPWVAGALVSNLWSVGGDDTKGDVNFFTLQYFINYNFEGGLYLTSAPIITSNWEAGDGEKWTVPFGGGVGKLFRIGTQPLNSNVQAFYNVVTPDSFGATWQFRFQIQALFPAS